ncbi:unnamed protein product [Didymodactylos carnosus]|uniref:Uncharacterized protein n=1 Tax=Didymodactylos carnosus TaxID=1234261 RepID=A0A816E4R2_9BILA|nr:unnamed protein product [Didymodactylos carnosus]CAF4563318.1 unnamed protein product [Didymodactylos carnosus]
MISIKQVFYVSGLCLLLILLYRTFIVFSPDKDLFEKCSTSHDHSLSLNNERLNALQTILKYKTVSINIRNQNYDALQQCRSYIKQRYSNILENKFVEINDIATYSILYTIKGTETRLKPYLLSAHIDVVPANIDKTNGEQWKHAPFDAVIDGEFIYGRGTLDDKTTVFGVMEAVQEYIRINGQPRRTFYVALTHDEEVKSRNKLS